MRRSILEHYYRFHTKPKVEVAVMTPARPQFIAMLLALVISQHGRKKKRTRRKDRAIYSRSQVTYMIDATMHPLTDRHWIFVVADGLLHAGNESEGHPIETLLKFTKY